MRHTERSRGSKTKDQILSFRMKRRKYFSSDFYEYHTDGHMLRSKERTHTDAKIDTQITPFSVKKIDCFISMSSITIRSTQYTLEMVRKSESNTSGWPTVARDADNYIHMHTGDGHCFDSLGWRREIRNSFDDVPDGALKILSDGIKPASNGLLRADM
jgi:hypothetical protein